MTLEGIATVHDYCPAGCVAGLDPETGEPCGFCRGHGVVLDGYCLEHDTEEPCADCEEEDEHEDAVIDHR